MPRCGRCCDSACQPWPPCVASRAVFRARVRAPATRNTQPSAHGGMGLSRRHCRGVVFTMYCLFAIWTCNTLSGRSGSKTVPSSRSRAAMAASTFSNNAKPCVACLSEGRHIRSSKLSVASAAAVHPLSFRFSRESTYPGRYRSKFVSSLSLTSCQRAHNVSCHAATHCFGAEDGTLGRGQRTIGKPWRYRVEQQLCKPGRSSDSGDIRVAWSFCSPCSPSAAV